MVHDQIEKWMRRLLYTERDEGPCVKLVLKHVQAGRSREGDVWSKSLPHSESATQLTVEDMRELAHEIEQIAVEDAEGLGQGTQQYKLLAYFLGSPNRPLARYTLNVEAGDDGELGPDPANGRGLLGQMMRHNESLLRQCMMGTTASMTILQRTLHRLAEQNETMMSQRLDYVAKVEELSTLKHERDLQMIESEHRIKMQEELFDKGKVLLPALVNKVAGRKLLTEPVNPQAAMLAAFAKSLTPEQFQGILGTLSSPQQIALITFMEQFQDPEETESESEKGAGNTGSNNGNGAY
jgi:hypothetical protein